MLLTNTSMHEVATHCIMHKFCPHITPVRVLHATATQPEAQSSTLSCTSGVAGVASTQHVHGCAGMHLSSQNKMSLQYPWPLLIGCQQLGAYGKCESSNPELQPPQCWVCMLLPTATPCQCSSAQQAWMLLRHVSGPNQLLSWLCCRPAANASHACADAL